MSAKNVTDIRDVMIINLIRALQDICNWDTMTPPRNWPSAHPGIKIIPKNKRRKMSLKNK